MERFACDCTRVESLARLQQLLARLEPLAEKTDLTVKAIERALREVRAAASAIPPLPTKQDFDDVTRRLKALQARPPVRAHRPASPAR